ncbi:DNA-binding IclR family transcriptional regulator [Sphingopyxis panaciterrae]|uniref:IclR family transcriptional regulator n=1 Tax=Sphingopyxis panaciterrae TaxID=363841 RepID=UPI0014233CFF|nr:helix-turn-helix domain-containing protein [Sphingopyxis panaciterrae]NIJ35460.1 DNA-binding IclR family transcriptional regulator [Sphingopyxis panaciterrae]
MSDRVRSVSQAFAILRLFADSDPLTLSDVSRALGLSPSTVFNLLNTLLAEGAIVREQPGKRYRLADAWRRSGLLRDGDARQFIDRMAPLLARFAQAHEATVGLWQKMSRDRMQLVAHAESDAVLRIHLARGQRQPLGGGAVGRAMAAASPPGPDEIARLFGAVRWQRPISFDAYVEQVEAAARAGYAMDDGYTHIGICTLATVVPDREDEFCASVSVFAGARPAAEVAALGRALVELAGTKAD